MKPLVLYSSLLIFNFSFLSAAPLPPSITTYIDAPVVEQRQVLTEEEIEELNVPDLPMLLQSAGIQLLSYGPYGLEQKPSIRGFTDETVRVIIDGVCVNNEQYGTFDFSTLNINDIEKIEIVRGGFTEGVTDEGSVGGAIYITTKKQSLGHHFISDTSVKTFFNFYYPLDTFSQSLGYSGQLNDSTFLKTNFKGTFANNKYFFTNYRNLRKQRDNARVMDLSASESFSHFFGNGNSITINDIFYAGNKQTPGSATAYSYGLQQDYDNNLTLQLSIPEAAPGLKTENTLSWLSNTRFYKDKTSGSAHYVNTVKYAGNLYYHNFDWFKESAGLTLDYTHLDSTDDGIHNQISGAIKSTSKFIISGKDDENTIAITLPLGAKFSNGNFAFTPKLGFAFNTTYVDFLIDGYRMTQFPNMDDLYWDGAGAKGNPDLTPESGWGGDFTINVHNVWLPFSLCAYTNYYENKIQWANLGSGWRPENVASAFYFGIDGRMEKTFWKDRITVKANGEFLYTKLLNKKDSYTYEKKIMWTPDFTGCLSAGVKLPGKGRIETYSIFTEANYMGKRYTTNMNITYMEPYLLWNLSAQMTIAAKDWRFTPYLRLDNILNTEYEAAENYPMPGISGTLGIKITR